MGEERKRKQLESPNANPSKNFVVKGDRNKRKVKREVKPNPKRAIF